MAKQQPQPQPPIKAAATQPPLPTVYDASLYEADAGSGFEKADKDAFAIPFLVILQSQSPQCKRSDGAYIPGAEEGKMLNTVTNQLFDGEAGIDVIPCFYRRAFLRWAPRESGGGFKGEMALDEPRIKAALGAGAIGAIDVDGDVVNDTRIHYVLILDQHGNFSPAVISMSSTQIRKSRQWMSKMDGIKMKGRDGRMFTAPMFSHVYHLTTVPEKNDQGSWYGWKIELARVQADPNLIEAAREFKKQIDRGEVREQVPAPLHPEDDDVAF